MFRVGEKIVCIKNGGKEFTGILNDKTYIVRNMSLLGNQVALVEIPNRTFYNYRFRTLAQIRKQKIDKICSRLEIK